MATKRELIAQAEELGVEVDPSWTKALLVEAIAEFGQEEDHNPAVAYRNLCNANVLMFGVKVPGGETYTPTHDNKQSEIGMAKLSRMIELKMVEKV